MADIGRTFGRAQIAETMRYLIEQGLVQISVKPSEEGIGFMEIEKQVEFVESFGMLAQNYGNMPSNRISLTDQGLKVMKLMGIGHP